MQFSAYGSEDKLFGICTLYVFADIYIYAPVLITAHSCLLLCTTFNLDVFSEVLFKYLQKQKNVWSIIRTTSGLPERLQKRGRSGKYSQMSSNL